MKGLINILKPTIFIVVLLLRTTVLAQSSYPYALETVTFNAETKRVDKIPFDKPFKVEIEKLPTQSIHNIFIYEMIYKGDTRCFASLSPDLIVSGSDVKKDDKKLWFIMPALKPQKHFDIVLISKEVEPYNKTLTLNKAIVKTPSDRLNIENLFIELKKSYDQQTGTCGFPVSSVKLGTVDDYLDLYNQGLNKVMSKIINYEGIDTTKNFEVSRFSELIASSKQSNQKIDTAAFLTINDPISRNASMKRIYKGVTRLSNVVMPEVDRFDLQKRIVNLESSISTLRLIQLQVSNVLNATEGGDKMILSDLDILIDALRKNKEVLLELYRSGNSLLDDQFFSNYNLLSTTVAKDLQTESSNRFLLDLGLANIGINDNRDDFNYIPKLAYGVNILFRPVDKSVPLNSLPGSIFSKDTSGLLAKKSIKHYLSLYIGFTIGEMNEPEFGDFYNNTSLMAGPSIRLYRAIRVSFGPALLRRVSANPVESRKRIAAGMFATASVDIDLLKAVSSIISPLTPSLK